MFYSKLKFVKETMSDIDDDAQSLTSGGQSSYLLSASSSDSEDDYEENNDPAVADKGHTLNGWASNKYC